MTKPLIIESIKFKRTVKMAAFKDHIAHSMAGAVKAYATLGPAYGKGSKKAVADALKYLLMSIQELGESGTFTIKRSDGAIVTMQADDVKSTRKIRR